MQSSAALLSFAEECGATVVEQFFSADRVVGRRGRKAALGRAADAVEMESFQVLLEARQLTEFRRLRFAPISDSVDEDLPLDMNEFLPTMGK